MSLSILRWLPLFLISIVCESGTHVCLKKSSQTHLGDSGFAYYLALARSKILWLGIGLYVAQIGIWIFILAALPLSVAFPLTGLEKPIMVLTAFIFLREPLSQKEWLSLVLIFAGIACVIAASPELTSVS